jgi:hypothetical protein
MASETHLEARQARPGGLRPPRGQQDLTGQGRTGSPKGIVWMSFPKHVHSLDCPVLGHTWDRLATGVRPGAIPLPTDLRVCEDSGFRTVKWELMNSGESEHLQSLHTSPCGVPSVLLTTSTVWMNVTAYKSALATLDRTFRSS